LFSRLYLLLVVFIFSILVALIHVIVPLLLTTSEIHPCVFSRQTLFAFPPPRPPPLQSSHYSCISPSLLLRCLSLLRFYLRFSTCMSLCFHIRT
jgi:hypothetical protein